MAITETPPPAPTPSPTDPEQHAPGDKEMTLLEHLEELRGRLVAGTLAVVVGVLVAIIPIPGFNSITWLAVDALVAAGPDSGVPLLTSRPRGSCLRSWRPRYTRTRSATCISPSPACRSRSPAG